MKLLFDEHLSPQLVRLLADLYPESSHVYHALHPAADDGDIWEFARSGGYMIVTKDDDFNSRSLLMGAPPKVVWARIGNLDTAATASILRRAHPLLVEFAAHPRQALQTLYAAFEDTV